MAWFTTEHRVLRSAVGLAARTGLVTRSWQLAWFMASFHAYRGLWREQVATSEIALPAVVRAQDLVGQAYLHRMLGRAQNEYSQDCRPTPNKIVARATRAVRPAEDLRDR